jgi:hypothetical protein
VCRSGHLTEVVHALGARGGQESPECSLTSLLQDSVDQSSIKRTALIASYDKQLPS